jgi:hypothetical protein
MATTTPNYGWPVPTSTDFVKDGAQAIEDLGDAIDATVFGLGSGGLTLVSTTTIGSAVSSVTVSAAFSATYDNYKIIVSNGAASTDCNLAFKLGASTTGYYSGMAAIVYSSNTLQSTRDNNGASFTSAGRGAASGLNLDVDLLVPFLAKNTCISGLWVNQNTAGAAGIFSGYHNSAVSYSDFTLTTSAGTLTGGEIRVYGYQN